MHEVCFASSSAHSILESLYILNDKLRVFFETGFLEEISNATILEFPKSENVSFVLRYTKKQKMKKRGI